MNISVKMWRREGIEFLRYEGETEEMRVMSKIANDMVDKFVGKGGE